MSTTDSSTTDYSTTFSSTTPSTSSTDSSTNEEGYEDLPEQVSKEISAINCQLAEDSSLGEVFAVKYQDGSGEIMSEETAREKLPPKVIDFCRAIKGETLTAEHAKLWGILDPEPLENESSERFDIQEVAYFENGKDLTIGPGFYGRISKRDRKFPIQMFTMVDKEGAEGPSSERVRMLFNICHNNPGSWRSVSAYGWRSKSARRPSKKILNGSDPIAFSSSISGGCVEASAANCILNWDPKSAKKLVESSGSTYFASLSEFGVFLQKTIRTWALQDPVKILSKKGHRSCWAPGEKLQWLLNRKDGIFLIQPLSKDGSRAHIVGADCGRQILYDPLEKFSMKLSHEALGISSGGKQGCDGIGEMRELVKLPTKTPSKRVRRGKKKRRTSKASNE